MNALRLTTVLFAASLLLASAVFGQAFAAKRVALVIGNADYKHASLLANPLNDAADIGAALGRLGFEVTRLDNAGYDAMRRGLKAFTRAAAASEIAVVFYAGHGIEVDGRNFLIPVDARLASDRDVEFEAVPLDLVSRSVDRASELRLIVLDACRNNPFANAMTRSGATRSIGRGLARVEPAGETLVAYAAKGGSVAADGAGRNSPYSTALLAHLEEPGLEVGLMFRKVRDAVLRSTGGRQEPFVYGSLSSRGYYLSTRSKPAPQVKVPTGPAVEAALGLKREERQRIQIALRAAGLSLYSLSYDGLFDKETRNAISRWQASLGKEPTGYLGAEGAKALLRLAPDLSFGAWAVATNVPCKLWNSNVRTGALTPGTWTGDCVSGKASGEGRATWQAGAITYFGQYRDGKRHGRGIYTSRGAGYFAPERNDGRRRDNYILIWRGDIRYEGEWKNDKRHGRGVETWKGKGKYAGDNIRYEGEWKDDKRLHVREIGTWRGRRYEKEWKNGKQHRARWTDGK